MLPGSVPVDTEHSGILRGSKIDVIVDYDVFAARVYGVSQFTWSRHDNCVSDDFEFLRGRVSKRPLQ